MVDGGGYTFYWKTHQEAQPLQNKLGLAIQNEFVHKIAETPTLINERLMTLRVPLLKGKYAIVLNCYAPTLINSSFKLYLQPRKMKNLFSWEISMLEGRREASV